MNITAPSKEAALSQILQTMQDHGIALRDIKQSLKDDKQKNESPASKNDLVIKLFTYIGATLIFAGLGLYASMVWEELQSLQRVLITLGTGFLAYILGLLFFKNEDLKKAVTPAFVVAFLLQPTGLFVALHEYSNGGSASLAAMIVFGSLAVQQVLTFVALKRPSLAMFSFIYLLGFLGGAVEYYNLNEPFSMLVIGLFFFLMTADLLRRSNYKDLTPFPFIVSGLLFLSGVYYYLGNSIYDLAIFCIILGFLVYSVFSKSRTLYVFSILGIIAYLCDGPGGGWYPWSWQIELSCAAVGTSLILCGLWFRQINHPAAIPLWLFFGSVYALGGLCGFVYQTPYEVSFIAISAFATFMALTIKSRAVLAVSLISMVSFISYYTEEHFSDVISWPLMLVFIGFILLIAGITFFKLGRKLSSA